MLTIEETVKKIKNGNLVIIPTETVYGIAASIYNYYAIKKIFILKKRPFCNPLIIHIGNINDLNKVAKNIPDKAWELVNYFFPGPLTLVLEKKKNILNLITSNQNMVAIRMPSHPIALQVIRKLGIPIVASSANLFNFLSPTSVENVRTTMPFLKNSILDGGICNFGLESTILSFTENKKIKLLRHGAISIEMIESILHEKLIIQNYNDIIYNIDDNISSEKIKNYSLKSRLIICNNFYQAISYYADKKIGVLSFYKTIDSKLILKQIILSQKKNLFEAAKTFFSSLYLLDSLNLDVILVKKFPNIGIGITLNHRLLRASKKILF